MTRTSCDVSGRVFEAKRRDAVHCSPACSRAAYALRHLPTVERAIRYLERERSRLRDLLTSCAAKRPGAS